MHAFFFFFSWPVGGCGLFACFNLGMVPTPVEPKIFPKRAQSERESKRCRRSGRYQKPNASRVYYFVFVEPSQRDDNIRRVSCLWLDRHGTVRKRLLEVDTTRERNIHRKFRTYSIRRGNRNWRRVFTLAGNRHRPRRFKSRQRINSFKRIGLFVRFRHV